MRYLQTLKVQLDDIVVLALSEALDAPSMGEFHRSGFVNGWINLKCVFFPPPFPFSLPPLPPALTYIPRSNDNQSGNHPQATIRRPHPPQSTRHRRRSLQKSLQTRIPARKAIIAEIHPARNRHRCLADFIHLASFPHLEHPRYPLPRLVAGIS